MQTVLLKRCKHVNPQHSEADCLPPTRHFHLGAAVITEPLPRVRAPRGGQTRDVSTPGACSRVFPGVLPSRLQARPVLPATSSPDLSAPRPVHVSLAAARHSWPPVWTPKPPRRAARRLRVLSPRPPPGALAPSTARAPPAGSRVQTVSGRCPEAHGQGLGGVGRTPALRPERSALGSLTAAGCPSTSPTAPDSPGSGQHHVK